VADKLWLGLVDCGWGGNTSGMVASLVGLLGTGPGLTFLGFSLFGGLVGVALAGRDFRIRSEVNALREARENLLEALLNSERFATMGEMAAEIGHEVNNYLAIARAQLELFAHTVGDSVGERGQQYLESLSGQLVRMHRMSRGLMGFSDVRQAREHCNLNDILRETIEFVRPLDRFRDVRFSKDLGELPDVLVDPQQIQQVFLNLLNNAADALRGRGGKITLTSCYWSEEDLVEVVVSDDGPGIPAAVLDRLFEPGFTTRADGHGYGLAVCKRIVEQHGARLSIRSKPGEGTTFVLTLPGTPRPTEIEEEPEFELFPAGSSASPV
jgi:two-component system NtrC family sensor kinase